MDKNVLVSVIIPVYNVEKYIKECVQSILDQTYKNIEILLIDDGSIDKSGEFCDNVAKSDNRIRVFHKCNEGLGLTRNYGLKYAKGDYVVFVDSDDYIENDSIFRMLREALFSDADLVVEGYKKITDNNQLIFEEKYDYQIFEGMDVKNIFLPRMIGSCPEKRDSIFTTVCSKLYKRDMIIRNSVNFHSERKLQSEDLGFQMELIPYLKKVIVTNNAGYYYRTNLHSLTTTYKQNRFIESKKVFKYIVEKIEELELPPETIYRADKMLFVQIKAAISQENPKINNKSWYECKKNVKQIVFDSLLQNEIENYPISRMQIKQRIFLYLLKYKLVGILMIGVLYDR